MEEGVTSKSEEVAASAPSSIRRGQSIWRTLLALTLLVVWLLIPTRDAPDPRADHIEWLLYNTYRAGYWCPILILFWVLAGKRSLDPVRDDQGNSTNGLSIWSTIVFMSLLAVWIAIPRQYSRGTFLTYHFFGHQIALWSLVGTFTWAFTGRRRSVFYLVLATIVIFWLPLLSNLTEQLLTGRTRMTYSTLHAMGIERAYGNFYKSLYELFRYGPR